MISLSSRISTLASCIFILYSNYLYVKIIDRYLFFSFCYKSYSIKLLIIYRKQSDIFSLATSNHLFVLIELHFIEKTFVFLDCNNLYIFVFHNMLDRKIEQVTNYLNKYYIIYYYRTLV